MPKLILLVLGLHLFQEIGKIATTETLFQHHTTVDPFISIKLITVCYGKPFNCISSLFLRYFQNFQ